MRGDWLRAGVVLFTLVGLALYVLWLIRTEERVRQQTGAHICSADPWVTQCSCVKHGPRDIFVPRGEEPAKRCPGK